MNVNSWLHKTYGISLTAPHLPESLLVLDKSSGSVVQHIWIPAATIIGSCRADACLRIVSYPNYSTTPFSSQSNPSHARCNLFVASISGSDGCRSMNLRELVVVPRARDKPSRSIRSNSAFSGSPSRARCICHFVKAANSEPWQLFGAQDV